MRNLSPLGAIHSPIDADRDVSAYLIDFDKLGLPDHSPFAILDRPIATPARCEMPKKRGPKPKRTNRDKVMASLRDNKGDHFNTPIPTREEGDRTMAILNRGMA